MARNPHEWAWIAFAHAGSTAIIAEAIQIGAPVVIT
jgi:hypothetical protein